MTLFFFLALTPLQNCKGNSLTGGRYIHVGGENLRFSTEIAVYLGNGTV